MAVRLENTIPAIGAVHVAGTQRAAFQVAELIKNEHYDDAKFWYERALAADPNHLLTWSYYGMWHAEQGNLLKAKDDLEKVRMICGNTDCLEYKLLKDVIDGTASY